jgi:hypothetical protein
MDDAAQAAETTGGDASSVAVPAAVAGRPTIDAIHRDIALANKYRIELIKYLLAISAALFAFTVTYRPSLTRVDVSWAMWLGWAGLGVSMVGGMFHMLGWDHYYKSYRDHDWKGRADPAAAKLAGKAARKKINAWRRFALLAQFLGFIVGVFGIGLFAAVNIDNVRKPDDHSPASAQQVPSGDAQQTQPTSSVQAAPHPSR